MWVCSARISYHGQISGCNNRCTTPEFHVVRTSPEYILCTILICNISMAFIAEHISSTLSFCEFQIWYNFPITISWHLWKVFCERKRERKKWKMVRKIMQFLFLKRSEFDLFLFSPGIDAIKSKEIHHLSWHFIFSFNILCFFCTIHKDILFFTQALKNWTGGGFQIWVSYSMNKIK